VSPLLDGLPHRHFGAILADPPWGFQTWSGPEKKIASRGTVAPYRTMEMDDLAKLPVGDVAAENAVLFLWVVWPTLPQAIDIMRAWGFEYKTCAFCWMKADPYKLFALEEDVYMGLGYWTRANSEVCLLGTRGKAKRQDNSVRQGIIESRREHSRKPDGVHERIERLVSGPYLELFARQRRPGWECRGNELDKFAPVVEAPYDPADDFAKSLEVGYQAIRERVAKGGPRGFMGEES
jgi:N6-adenosine-specific RNA methylase IME4